MISTKKAAFSSPEPPEPHQGAPKPGAGRAAAAAYQKSAILPAGTPERELPVPAPLPGAGKDSGRPEFAEDLDAFKDREQLITECLPLVKFVAHRISARLPSHVEVDDLIHSGILGLIDAIKKFEPGRNVKFKTYAEQRVRGAILDGLRDLDWVPRSLRRKKKDIENAYHFLEQHLGRAATDEEVALHLAVTLEELHKSLDELKGVTLGAFMEAGEDGEGENLISFIPDPDAEDPSLTLQARELRKMLKDAVEKLPTKERFVVQLYYFDELTMKEIGTLLNITESRVSQLHTKSMLRLRGKLKERQIDS
jgi:RNA polymerase sigma factor for flagellar operon FliA